jgi:hypothetical protein
MIIGVKDRIFALISVATDGAAVIVGRSAPTVASAFATGLVMAFSSSQPFFDFDDRRVARHGNRTWG